MAKSKKNSTEQSICALPSFGPRGQASVSGILRALSRELPRMLAAAVFDRGRQVGQPIEIIKAAGIRQIVRLKNPGARIWKRWGAKREDAWRLRLRRGSASVRWWLFLASQPLQPCQLHDFNFAGGSENAGIPEFRLTSQVLRKCTTGPSPCAQVHLLRTLGISAPSCGALSEQYSYKTTTVGSTRDLIHPVEGPAKMCVTQLR